MTQPLFTIGYEGSTQLWLLKTLHEYNGIKTVIDVRSRVYERDAGFSKEALRTAFARMRIDYIRMPQEQNPQTDPASHPYCNEFQKRSNVCPREDMARIATLAMSSSVCLLGYQSNQNFCIRERIADGVAAMTQKPVTHIRVCPPESAPYFPVDMGLEPIGF